MMSKILNKHSLVFQVKNSPDPLYISQALMKDIMDSQHLESDIVEQLKQFFYEKGIQTCPYHNGLLLINAIHTIDSEENTSGISTDTYRDFNVYQKLKAERYIQAARECVKLTGPWNNAEQHGISISDLVHDIFVYFKHINVLFDKVKSETEIISKSNKPLLSHMDPLLDLFKGISETITANLKADVPIEASCLTYIDVAKFRSKVNKINRSVGDLINMMDSEFQFCYASIQNRVYDLPGYSTINYFAKDVLSYYEEQLKVLLMTLQNEFSNFSDLQITRLRDVLRIKRDKSRRRVAETYQKNSDDCLVCGKTVPQASYQEWEVSEPRSEIPALLTCAKCNITSYACVQCYGKPCRICGGDLVPPHALFPNNWFEALSHSRPNNLERIKDIACENYIYIDELVDQKGCTSLSRAANKQDYALCKYLIDELGASVEMQNKNGETALLIMIKFRHGNLSRKQVTLFSKSVNIPDHDGITPLMHASVGAGLFGSNRGNLKIINHLIKLGARVDARDHNGDTALDYAIYANNNSKTNSNQDVIDLLSQAMRFSKGSRAC